MRTRTLIGAGLAVALAAAAAWGYHSTASAQPYGGWGMMGGGYGPGMMGYGCPGYDRSAAQGNQNLNLTTDDVKNRVERWLAWRGNPRLKLGEVKEKDADTITADVVTKDNSLVERFVVDRHTGFIRRDNS